MLYLVNNLPDSSSLFDRHFMSAGRLCFMFVCLNTYLPTRLLVVVVLLCLAAFTYSPSSEGVIMGVRLSIRQIDKQR